MLQGLNFVLLHVTDIEQATAFYTEKFGLDIESKGPGFVQFKQPMGGAPPLPCRQRVTARLSRT